MSEASRELVIFDHNVSCCRIVVISVSPSLQGIFSFFTGKLVLAVVVLSIHLETPFLCRTTDLAVARSGSTLRNH